MIVSRLCGASQCKTPHFPSEPEPASRGICRQLAQNLPRRQRFSIQSALNSSSKIAAAPNFHATARGGLPTAVTEAAQEYLADSRRFFILNY
jgi:hypothetical protein